jgi:hypothetical protein
MNSFATLVSMKGCNRNSLAWVILAVGLSIPWIVGTFVKLNLDSKGVSTVDWSYFLSPIDLLGSALFTIWLGLPYVYLAFASRASKNRSTNSILTAFGLALAGSIILYLIVWQSMAWLIVTMAYLPIPPFLLMLLGFVVSDKISSK